MSCCVAGGGPAGLFLGHLLARSGVSVVVLEKHADFLRDFRGDTVHPSTLEILQQLDLLEEFRRLPHQEVQQLAVRAGDEEIPVVDFRGLRPFDLLALVPQWDFLDLLAAESRRYPAFELRMRHEVTGLLRRDGRVAGVRVRGPAGEYLQEAEVVVACDGRDSTLRRDAGLRSRELGAPMDVLWFRLPKTDARREGIAAILGAGRMMVLIDRGDSWQTAYVVPKGTDDELRRRPLEELRESVTELAPFLAEAVAGIGSWADVRTLEVEVDRLERWRLPGLLLIGDAAHAMSPIGGVGINLAIQDAIAAANALGPALRQGRCIDDAVLRRVERRRLLPTRVIQRLQLLAQRRIVARTLERAKPPRVPALLRWLLRFRRVRNVPARLIGYGVRRERVRLPLDATPLPAAAVTS